MMKLAEMIANVPQNATVEFPEAPATMSDVDKNIKAKVEKAIMENRGATTHEMFKVMKALADEMGMKYNTLREWLVDYDYIVGYNKANIILYARYI
jgi:hypothetical protein